MLVSVRDMFDSLFRQMFFEWEEDYYRGGPRSQAASFGKGWPVVTSDG